MCYEFYIYHIAKGFDIEYSHNMMSKDYAETPKSKSDQCVRSGEE